MMEAMATTAHLLSQYGWSPAVDSPMEEQWKTTEQYVLTCMGSLCVRGHGVLSECAITAIHVSAGKLGGEEAGF